MKQNNGLIIPAIIFLFFHLVFLFPTACFGQNENKGEHQIQIEKIFICRGVVNRTPIEAGDFFSHDVKKLYCFTRVVGAQEDTEIIHNWYHKGKLTSRIVLPVKSSNWRTFSMKDISPDATGEWNVEILLKDGRSLKNVYFLIR